VSLLPFGWWAVADTDAAQAFVTATVATAATAAIHHLTNCIYVNLISFVLGKYIHAKSYHSQQQFHVPPVATILSLLSLLLSLGIHLLLTDKEGLQQVIAATIVACFTAFSCCGSIFLLGWPRLFFVLSSYSREELSSKPVVLSPAVPVS
jgi:hypothetical protein